MLFQKQRTKQNVSRPRKGDEKENIHNCQDRMKNEE
jgi:hypothetical protein